MNINPNIAIIVIAVYSFIVISFIIFIKSFIFVKFACKNTTNLQTSKNRRLFLIGGYILDSICVGDTLASCVQVCHSRCEFVSVPSSDNSYLEIKPLYYVL